MDAPVCRLCETKHWSREPCPSRPTKVARHRPLKPAPVFSETMAMSTESSALRAPHQRWDREAYNAYQRAYMKKLRARVKKAKAKRRARKTR